VSAPPPADDRAWRRESSRVLVSDRWLHLEAARMRTPEGSILDPYYLLRERDWVCCLPLLGDGRLVVAAQYRPGAERVTWEFPAGDIDDGESPREAALRELAEETGHRPVGDSVPLPALYPDPSRNSVRGHAFVVPVAERAGAQDLGHGEAIRVHRVSRDELVRARDDGRFCHAAHVAWLALAIGGGLLQPA